MEVVGLVASVAGLCANIQARLESVRTAPLMAQGLLSRIQHTQSCLSRLTIILDTKSSPLASDPSRHDSLRHVESSLRELNDTTEKLQNDLRGKSWRRIRSRLPFALDTSKSSNYERKLDQLLADITVFIGTTNLEQVSSMVQGLQNLQISSQAPLPEYTPTQAEHTPKQGFNLGFHLANVPSIHYFEGRESYLQRLANGLLPDSQPGLGRKVEIVQGLGGLGKTSLTVQFAKIYENKFSSIFFIDANSQESISRSFQTIHLLIFGERSSHAKDEFEEQGSSDTVKREVLEWFCLDGNTRWLLIFDNVDRQPSDHGGINIAEYFPPGNRGSILITTRLNPLQIYGLSKPQIALEPMSSIEAKNLLAYYTKLDHHAAVRASYSGPTEQDDKLLTRLGGLPLAIAQAGSFLKSTNMSTTKYLDLYDSSRKQLFESHRPLFGNSEENPRGNIGTTWNLSINHLRNMSKRMGGSGKRYSNALMLLKLLPYFEPTDIDFTIIRRGLISHNIPTWFEETFRDELSFITTAEILVETSLLNRTGNYGTYSMHRVVYDWLCASNDDIDEQVLGLALCAIAFSAPGRLYKRWKDDEKRLVIHINAMEHRLLRCKFTTGVPMINFLEFTEEQHQRALLLVRDQEWYTALEGVPHCPLSAITYFYSVIEKPQTSLQIIDAALASSRQSYSIKHMQATTALLRAKGIILYREKDFKGARSCMVEAAGHATSLQLDHDLREARLLTALIEDKEERSSLAHKILIDNLDECKRLGFGLYHPSTFSALLELIILLERRESAERCGFDTIKERIRLLEPYRAEAEENVIENENARLVLAHLGAAYQEANLMSEAARILETTLAAMLACEPVRAHDLTDVYYDLTRVYIDTDPAKAAQYCGKWVVVQETLHGPKSMKAAQALSDLCVLLNDPAVGDYSSALEAGLRASEIIKPEEGREYWRLCQRLADAYTGLKDRTEAWRWGCRAAESAAAVFGTVSKEHAAELLDQGRLYEKVAEAEAPGSEKRMAALDGAWKSYNSSLQVAVNLEDDDAEALARAALAKCENRRRGIKAGRRPGWLR